MQDDDTKRETKRFEIIAIRKTIQVHIRICVSARKTIIHLKMLKKKSRYQITNTMTSISGFGLCVSCYNSCHIIAYVKKFKFGILAMSISLHSFWKKYSITIRVPKLIIFNSSWRKKNKIPEFDSRISHGFAMSPRRFKIEVTRK